MRCTDAIVAAFLSHPSYQKREDFIKMGFHIAFGEETHISKKVVKKNQSWAFARYLPKDSAKYGLTQCLPEIVRRQLSTGLWGRKFAEKRSYGILRALKHAQMLPDLVSNGVLRYDPYKCFSKSSDFYGFLIRRNIIGVMLPEDPLLQRQLVSQITDMQRENGSWEGTVFMTSLQIENLLELGLDTDETCITNGANWIFSQFRESINRHSPEISWGVFLDVFTGEDCGAEFRSALETMPEEDPRHGCFVSLPLIQTAFALRTLAYLGFANDTRVLNAYESLLGIQLLPERQTLLASKRPAGSWCAIGCRRMLEEEVKAEQRLKRKGLA